MIHFQANKRANAYTVVSANPNMLCLPVIGILSQIQSTSNAAVCRRVLLCSQTEQSLKSGHGLVTPIVAKNKLIEVNLKLRTADSVVGTDQPLLELTDCTVGQGHD